ncbi:hypothetical protein DFA_00262 [Cavenderia fasciculata]|uniref:Ankyrin repeat-containing protein n=1 Tax=Cavenderia fasciculata TaxID=261658 RepID=F4PY24_CACFS|nr:uncharacterized protein DFA_00262 [Cavenderia fasciculata]EGG19684.1 hypothetical protein DFA_00262 [Cavenderia fasciculata]|eukprot:XP_004357978.1 hypothetical protein DFA_00262 [Cavenderia fasciculata]
MKMRVVSNQGLIIEFFKNKIASLQSSLPWKRISLYWAHYHRYYNVINEKIKIEGVVMAGKDINNARIILTNPHLKLADCYAIIDQCAQSPVKLKGVFDLIASNISFYKSSVGLFFEVYDFLMARAAKYKCPEQTLFNPLKVLTHAIESGNYDLYIRVLWTFGLKLTDTSYYVREGGTNRCLAYAAISNNAELVKFLHQEGGTKYGSLASIVPFLLPHQNRLYVLLKRARQRYTCWADIDYYPLLQFDALVDPTRQFSYEDVRVDGGSYGHFYLNHIRHYRQSHYFQIGRKKVPTQTLKTDMEARRIEIDKRNEIVDYLRTNNVLNPNTIRLIHNVKTRAIPIKYFDAENSFVNLFDIGTQSLPKFDFK